MIAAIQHETELHPVSFTAPLTIGRSISCSLRLFWDTGVSRNHCLIYQQDEVLIVEDQGSQNGTFVNGHRIENPAELHDGDVLIVGETLLTVHVKNDDRHSATNQTARRIHLQ